MRPLLERVSTRVVVVVVVVVAQPDCLPTLERMSQVVMELKSHSSLPKHLPLHTRKSHLRRFIQRQTLVEWVKKKKKREKSTSFFCICTVNIPHIFCVCISLPGVILPAPCIDQYYLSIFTSTLLFACDCCNPPLLQSVIMTDIINGINSCNHD